jgi:hypothetical protein
VRYVAVCRSVGLQYKSLNCFAVLIIVKILFFFAFYYVLTQPEPAQLSVLW